MRRLVLLVLAALCLTAGLSPAAAFFLIHAQSSADDTIIPTLMVLPSLTPTDRPAPTLPPTLTATFVATANVAPTGDSTADTHAELEHARVGIHSDHAWSSRCADAHADFRQGTMLLPAPPDPVDPLPDATDTAPPFLGWYRFESDYPTIRYERRPGRRA